MPSVRSQRVGGISGVNYDPSNGISNFPVSDASTVTSRDRNRFQMMTFVCEPEKPFSGIVEIWVSTSDSPGKTDLLWSVAGTVEMIHEGGSFSIQVQGEFLRYGFVCKAGDYWTTTPPCTDGIISPSGGSFTVNGDNVTISPGDSVSTIISTINSSLSPTNTAEAVQYTNSAVTDSFIIIDKTGSPIDIVETVGTPLMDLGIDLTRFSTTTPGSYHVTPGNVSTIELLY